MFKKAIRLAESQGIITTTPGVGGFGKAIRSTPTVVDVSANGMAKKYSRGSIRTSYGSSGLLTGSRLKKKTLLGE
jgi:hypothetical protein